MWVRAEGLVEETIPSELADGEQCWYRLSYLYHHLNGPFGVKWIDGVLFLIKTVSNDKEAIEDVMFEATFVDDVKWYRRTR